MPPRRANAPTRLTSDHPPSITSKQHTSITNHYCARGRVAKKAKRGRTKRASCERPPRPRALSASLPASLGPCALCVCQACTPARIQRESPPPDMRLMPRRLTASCRGNTYASRHQTPHAHTQNTHQRLQVLPGVVQRAARDRCGTAVSAAERLSNGSCLPC